MRLTAFFLLGVSLILSGGCIKARKARSTDSGQELAAIDFRPATEATVPKAGTAKKDEVKKGDTKKEDGKEDKKDDAKKEDGKDEKKDDKKEEAKKEPDKLD